MKKSLALASAALLVTLTACGGGVKKDATYEDAGALRDAVIKSGQKCPGETVEITSSERDASKVKCDKGLQLEVINDDQLMGLMPITISTSKSEYSYLLGQNWVIQGETSTLDELKAKLGGELTVP